MKGVHRQFGPRERSKLLRLMGEGHTVTASAKGLGISVREVYRYAEKDLAFRDEFARMRVLQTHVWVDKLIDLADQPCDSIAEVQRRKLKFDIMRFVVSKIAPRQWGDKLHTDHTHTIGVVMLPPIETGQLAPLKQIAEAVVVHDHEK